MLGGWAMFLLARRRLGGLVAAVLTVAMLATPTLMYQPLNSFYFYISALAPFLFAWYFHEERRMVPFVLCCGWLLTAREDMGLAVGALGALAGWERWREGGAGRWSRGLVGAGVGLVGLLWWVGMVKFVMPRYGSAAGEATLSWYAGWGSTPGEMLGRLLTEPGFVGSVVLTRLKLSYAWSMVRASGGLGWTSLPALLSAPFWAVNLLVTRPQAATANMFYHYSTLVVGASYAALPRALERWSGWRGAQGAARGGRAWVLGLFVLAMSASTAPLVYTRAQLGALVGGEEVALFERVLAQVPPDGEGVAAPSRMLPALVEGHPMLLASDRPMGYTTTRLPWVILAEGDGTYHEGDWSKAQWESYFDSFRKSPHYERVYSEGGYSVYRRRP
jgi:hypothetical protein